MRCVYSKFAVLIVLVCAASVQAHDDLVPYEFGGKIATGGHDDVTNTDTVLKHVFGYDFAEDPGDPNIIGDPGFNNGAFAIGVFPNNGLLAPNKTLGFDVLTPLQYWDGNGAISFANAPVGSLGVRRSSNTVTIDGLGHTGTLPTIGSTGTGRLHVHLESQLSNAPDGIYLVGLQLKYTDDSLFSDPIYVVYNNLQALILSSDPDDHELAEEIHDAAMGWVQDNLVTVPEPMSAGLAGLAGIGFVIIAHRRRSMRHASKVTHS